MGTPFELFIARRYLRARRKTGFINLITYISIGGVAIGVAALIIVLTVMNGFEEEVRSRIIGFDSHIRVRRYHNEGMETYNAYMDSIRSIPRVVGVSPYILEKGIILKGKRSTFIFLKGAEQETVSDVSDLNENIKYGDLEFGLAESKNGKKLPGIVVGWWVLDALLADIGDEVIVTSGKGFRPSLGWTPPMKQFVITGAFQTGFFEFDNTFVFMSIESAQQLLRMGDTVSGIEVKVDDYFKAKEVSDKIDEKIGFPYTAMTWFEMKKNLFSWMQLEKWAMFIILCLIILVAAFNIISTLIMMVMEKTREIGILKAMGATSKSVLRIFLYEGIVVGVIGTFIGCLIGYLLCWAQIRYDFISIPGDVYFISSLPMKMQPLDFVWISAAALFICLAASIYPARRASKLIPVDAIRYE
jgi:lipoprotein-releasing system permease protein